MTNKEAVNWIINLSADVSKAEHRDLWHYEQALSEIRDMIEEQSEPYEGDDLRADVYHLAEKIGIHRLYALVVDLRGEPEPCEDAVPRTSVEYICRKNTVSTNPYEHKYHDKFIEFMDDPEISDFGMWQHSNGFNTALVAVQCDLDKVPSAQPEVVRCKDCKHHHYDSEDIPYCNRIDYGYGWKDYDFCSRAERREK